MGHKVISPLRYLRTMNKTKTDKKKKIVRVLSSLSLGRYKEQPERVETYTGWGYKLVPKGKKFLDVRLHNI